ncbi:hypothetical protein [Actinocatenispora rupis]|uniref:Uncharacterized protein n=1 Tax=Actinocatenispora rupis TaxID=519421 RepID=A0A8J3J524_9ACTN|nr:hypothetical protein [Actinocatenispora rupis]GID10272.1 hypothetical protein Aru02nite_11610 [Actinocatenispora rupis]
MYRRITSGQKTPGRLLLAQVPGRRAGDSELRDLVTDALDGGLVVTGDNAIQTVRSLRRDTSPVLVDRARYQGNSRTLADQAFDPTWIRDQRALGLPWVLPDAGYVDADDRDGLRSVLRRTAQLGDDAVALLALNLAWLKNQRVPVLLDAIRTVGVPVALVLEHKDDPLGVQDAMRGLLRVLALPVPVMLLRSDVSAVGALCFGAVAAAVGVDTSLRHLYPRGGGGPPGRPREASALFRPCLAYKRIGNIAAAVARDPDNPVWQCRCRYCAGRPITMLRTASDVGWASALHSLDLLYQLRDETLHRTHTVLDNQTSWVEKCSLAAGDCAELAERYPGGGWAPPKALENWVEFGGGSIRRPVDR